MHCLLQCVCYREKLDRNDCVQRSENLFMSVSHAYSKSFVYIFNNNRDDDVVDADVVVDDGDEEKRKK